MTSTKHSTKTYAQDLHEGMILTLGSHHVSKQEIVDFAQQWDPQGFHVDEDIAKDGYFGELIASGIHTLGNLQRLLVTERFDYWAVIAGKAIDQLTFDKPVFPGDTLTGEVTVKTISLDSRNRGHLQLFSTLHNQHGDVVMTSSMQLLMHAAPLAGAEQ